jgi:leucyl aminopeptidase
MTQPTPNIDLNHKVIESANSIIAVPIFEDAPHISAQLNRKELELIEEIIKNGEFKGEEETSLLIHTPSSNSRLLLIGLGSYADMKIVKMFRAAGIAVREAKALHGSKHLQLVIPKFTDKNRLLLTAVEGAINGLYEGNLYQKKEEEETILERLTIVVSELMDDLQKTIRSITYGRIIGEAMNWTRQLSDEPANQLPPRELARHAEEMAKEFGLRVESIYGEEIEKRGMGGLWGIGKGSEEKPVLIVIHYDPPNTESNSELYAFVGKGITFDTGGLSLKPPKNMEEMKADMAGGAAVLGALRVIAQLKPNRRVVGIIPTAENMPSGRSIKPGDIVKTLAGFTIEVVDTDAEGRVVLVDGIAYAKELGASYIVDLATLTGSIVVALGDHRTGLFSNNDEFAKRVIEAGERAGEPMWRMPVSDDYKKRIESMIADFKNYGGRPDASAAALLLSKFAKDTPWVHLDIAATSWYDDPQPYAPKGSTGIGIRTLVELIFKMD